MKTYEDGVRDERNRILKRLSAQVKALEMTGEPAVAELFRLIAAEIDHAPIGKS